MNPIDYLKIPSPCYVLEERLLQRNLELINYIKKEAKVNIIPAFKGFALWGAFPLIKPYINSTAASSVNEARLAYEEMNTLAHTYSPAYTDEDFDEIMQYSSHITFNSLSQFERFQSRIKSFDRKISIGIRINPEFSEVETELYNPCAPGSRLGIPVSQLPTILPSEIEGLHLHALCESSSFDLEKLLTVVEEKFGSYLTQVKWINLGGGHLITRKDYNTTHLISLLTNFRKKYNLEIILEPGSAFAWETGVLVSSVIDIVENNSIKTAILNVSFAAHMPDCLEMPYKPHIIGAYHEPQRSKPTYRIGGNSCLAGDYIGDWSFDNNLKPGDRIIFEDMIHYTMVKTNFFNGVNHPSIGIWTSNGIFKLLRKFNYTDYRNKLS